MKTPEEIKKGLECCNVACEWDNGCPYMGLYSECTEGLKTDALAYIQQLEERNTWHEGNTKYLQSFMNDLSKQLAQLEAKVPKWISVEEQPEPPEDDVYYCYGYWLGSGRKQAETAEYLCGEWKIENNFVLTHWMYLPEPPVEE